MVGSTATALTVGVAGCGEEEGPGAEDGDGDGDGVGDGGTTPTDAADGATPTETEDGAGGTDTEGGAGGTDTDETETTGTGTTGGEETVDMVTEDSEYFFDPIGLFVEPGTTVTWNNASGSHSSTAYAESLDAADVTRIPEGAEPWNSEILSEEGATFEHTFEAEGTYDYFCIPHKQLGMVGRIVVGQPGGPAEEGSVPDGELPASQDIVDQGSISYDDFSG